MSRRLGGKNTVPYNVVYRQEAQASDQKLYRVKKGLVWLVRTDENGRSLVVDEVYPGEYFGQEIWCAGVYRSEARQMFPGGVVEEVLWHELPRHEQQVVYRDIADRLANNRWPERVLFGEIQCRLFLYLKNLVRRGLGKQVGDSFEVFLLRHEDLALVLASTRETITVALGKLKRQRLIRITDNRRTFLLPAERSK